MTSSAGSFVLRRKPEVDTLRRTSCVALIALSCLMVVAVGQQRDPEGQGEGLLPDRGGECSSVQEAYGSKGFNEHDAPHQMIKGHNLMICKQEFSCCTQEMEEKLNLKNSHDISQLIMDKLNSYRQNLVTPLIKFDDYFVDLIDRSHSDLHEMFLRTFGLLYQQDVKIFVDLFRDLQSYYKKTNVDIQDVLDKFFSLLMQRIFRLLNSERLFSDGFFTCIDEHLDELRPFGDIPLRLYLQIKRSFTAARVFVDGLAMGRDVVLAMSKLEHTHSCLDELMKLTFCSYCGGFTDVKPCTNYCLAVFRECIGFYANINRLWNSYLGEMLSLANRLDGPFNIEMVVSPLGVKLSEAIMDFQENSDSFSSKVFQGCGEPKLRPHPSNSQNETRRKRDASTTKSLDFDFGTTQSSNPNPVSESLNHSIFGSGKANLNVNLNRLIRDVQGKLNAMRDIWKNLPEVLCIETYLSDSSESPTCWNGSSASRKSDDGESEFSIDEEASNGPARHSNVIEKELYELRSIISKIRNAHSGINENFADNVDDRSGSGDQSGSGSDDPDRLHTTKDIYIDGVSLPLKSTTDPHADIASTRQTPSIISSASDIHVGFQTSLAGWVTMSTLTFLFLQI